MSTKETPPTRSAKRWLGACLLPLSTFLGFVLLFALLFRDRLLPGKAVDVVPAIGIEETITRSTTSEHRMSSGKPLFQASGWVEPDPLPIKATALTDGIVDQVHVLQGALVKKGDLLATLIGDDNRLERDAMAAKLADMKASFDAHCVGTQIAIRQIDAEKAMLEVAEANVEEAADKLRRYDKMTEGAITGDERLAVRLDHRRRLAEVDLAKARIGEIAEELTKIAYEILAIQAQIKRAEIDLEKAELACKRTRIHAPVDGRILALKAAPGAKKMVGMDEEDSSTIAILYDPAHLQVRVDVPLADAAGLSVGQAAKIRCNLLPDEIFEGIVTRIEGAADLQRNTLQAKVRIADPSDKLRPEMLSRVEFLETLREDKSDPSAIGVAVYVSASALTEGTVWVCDADTRRAERRQVVSSATAENLVRIDSGLRPGEWVVSDPAGLREGERLKPLFNERR